MASRGGVRGAGGDGSELVGENELHLGLGASRSCPALFARPLSAVGWRFAASPCAAQMTTQGEDVAASGQSAMAATGQILLSANTGRGDDQLDPTT